MAAQFDQIGQHGNRLAGGVAKAIFLTVFDTIELKDRFLLLVPVPVVFPVFPPPKDDGLHVELPIGAHKGRLGLLPDKPCPDLETGIFKSIVKDPGFDGGVEHIDGSIGSHSVMETGEGFFQKFISFLVIEVIVFDFPGGALEIHQVWRIRQDKIWLGASQEFLIRFRLGGISAQDPMFP